MLMTNIKKQTNLQNSWKSIWIVTNGWKMLFLTASSYCVRILFHFWWMWVLNFDLNFILQSYQIQTTNMREITSPPPFFSLSYLQLPNGWLPKNSYEGAKYVSPSRNVYSKQTYNFWLWPHASIEDKVIFTFIWIIRMVSEWKEEYMECKCECKYDLIYLICI